MCCNVHARRYDSKAPVHICFKPTDYMLALCCTCMLRCAVQRTEHSHVTYYCSHGHAQALCGSPACARFHHAHADPSHHDLSMATRLYTWCISCVYQLCSDARSTLCEGSQLSHLSHRVLHNVPVRRGEARRAAHDDRCVRVVVPCVHIHPVPVEQIQVLTHLALLSHLTQH